VIKDVLLGIIPIRLEYFKLIAEHKFWNLGI